MTTLDAKAWGKRNLWRSLAGATIVRPGLRVLLAPETGRKFVGGFSIQNERTSETWHYVFDVATTGPRDLRLVIKDAAFVTFQELELLVDADPRAITHAAVFSELFICSPDFPTLWGRIGVGMTYAEAQASVSGIDVIDPIPRGICTHWNNRAVICDGRSMYVSDPVALGGGTIRSFIGANANQRPGIVYGIHEGAAGMLVAVTSAGVYGLDSSASASGVVGANGADWRLLNHNAATSYESSCVVRGRTFGLTQAGFALIDTDNDSEQVLSDAEMTRAYGPRIASADWRTARLFAGDLGPVVGHSAQKALHMFDTTLLDGFASWWTGDDEPVLRGILRDVDGDQLLLCEGGVYRAIGDFDGDVALTSGLTNQPRGGFFGSLPAVPSRNQDVKAVHAAAAVGGAGSIAVAVRGSGHSGVPVVDPEGFTIGTDAWTDDKRATATPIADLRVTFGPADALPTREPSIEVMVDGCLTRISESIDVIEAGGATSRPSKVG